MPADDARALWDRWARYESQFGDLAAIHKLDGRISEAYPEAKSIFRFAERHVYAGLTQMIVRDLGMGVTVRSRSTSRSPSPDIGLRRKRGASPAGQGAKRRRGESPAVLSTRENGIVAAAFRAISPVGRVGSPASADPLEGARFLLQVLPPASAFNGPVFSADSLIDVLSQATIPSSVTGDAPAPGGRRRRRK